MRVSKVNGNNITVVIILLTILGLGAFFRIHNLTQYPGWYSDEGTDLNIISNLISGRIQYLALKDSLLIVGRLPLIYFLLKPLALLFGNGIGLIRGFTATSGIIAILLIYIFVKKASKDFYLALASAFLYAIYPGAIFYSRIGYLYNFLTPMLLIILIGTWTYLQSESFHWLFVSSLSLGICLISEIIAWTWLPIFALIIFTKSRKSAIRFIAISLIPVAVMITWMLATGQDAFLFDLRFTLNRMSNPLPVQFIRVLFNFASLGLNDIWWLLGWIGLFILPDKKLRNFLVMIYLVPWILMARSLTMFDIGAYYAIPLYVYVVIGCGGLIRYGLPRIDQTFRSIFSELITSWGKLEWSRKSNTIISKSSVIFSALALSLFISPIIMQLFNNNKESSSGYQSKIDPILINPRDARITAQYINKHRIDNKLIIGSPAFVWQLPNNVSDFQVSLVSMGNESFHLPGDIPESRFAYNPRFETAQFIVIDPIWHNWASVNIPELKEIMEWVENDWVLVFQSGDMRVYENPAN